MKLLTVNNTKTMKGEKQGYKTYILHLSPSNRSGYNVCPSASVGCIAACLNTAGHGGMFRKGETTNGVQEARIRKTKMFFEDRTTFMSDLVREIENAIKYCAKHKLTPVFRLNGTSDIRWETVGVNTSVVRGKKMTAYLARNLMEAFPDIRYYDYTKLSNRRDIPANYHLTFSRSETNDDILPSVTHNIAVVFNTKRNGDLPTEYIGRKVIDGDKSDLRFLDADNVIVGLRAKGRALKDDSGFVVAV